MPKWFVLTIFIISTIITLGLTVFSKDDFS